MQFYDREASIIIPTYNRAELLEFTLLSLFEQSVSANRFEVIVVNDGSTDDTMKALSRMRTPYRLKVIQNNSNRGAAYSRNQGIKASSGEILIFLDEMLADNKYVEKELDYHKVKEMVVAAVFNGQFIYTHFYANFSPEQRREYLKTARMPGISHNQTDKKGVIRLFRPRQVKDHSILHYGFKNKYFILCYRDLQALYGKFLQEMAAPWFMFVTNSVSLSRDLLEEAGYFDEEFKGAYFEEWELGYRLHQAGATFYNADDINCYHQAHPSIDSIIKIKNYLYFSKKHPVVEVLLVSAMWPPFNWTLLQWGKFVTQFKKLESTESSSFKELIKAVKDLSETLHRLASEYTAERTPPFLETAEAGYHRWEPSFASKVREQLHILKMESLHKGKYREIAKRFEDLLILPVNFEES